MSAPAVEVHVTPSLRFDRIQLLLRVILMCVLAIFGISLGWLFWLLFLALPVIAAIRVSTRGSEHYLSEDAPRIARALGWLTAFQAYVGLLTDRFPDEIVAHENVHVVIHPEGHPTVRGALLRLLGGIPAALALVFVGFVSVIVWLIAAISVLVSETYPASLQSFQAGVLRWQTGLLAYQASIVEAYPHFTEETGTGTTAAA